MEGVPAAVADQLDLLLQAKRQGFEHDGPLPMQGQLARDNGASEAGGKDTWLLFLHVKGCCISL